MKLIPYIFQFMVMLYLMHQINSPKVDWILLRRVCDWTQFVLYQINDIAIIDNIDLITY